MQYIPLRAREGGPRVSQYSFICIPSVIKKGHKGCLGNRADYPSLLYVMKHPMSQTNIFLEVFVPS